MDLYQKVVSVNKETHRNHKLKLISDLSFTADMQTTPLLATEFVAAAKEYPIVFVKTDTDSSGFVPMTLLGLQNGENLYIGADGTWNAKYIPAFIRRYPFIFAETGNNQFTLCVDSNCSAFNETDGVALFNDGQETQFLKDMLEFVTNFHRDSIATTAFVKELQTLGLLEEKNLKADLNDGREFLVRGVFVINEEKLMQLDAAQTHGLLTRGYLAPIYYHLMSLSNMNKLVDLAATNKTAS